MTATSPRADPKPGAEAARGEGHCKEHGTFEAELLFLGGARPIQRRCPQCVERNEATRRQQEAEADRRRDEERRAAWVRDSGVRGRYLSATFGTFTATTQKTRAVLKACQVYIEHVRSDEWSGLWLIGSPGTGKTHLGAAAVLAAINVRGVRAVLATPREIVRELRATWRRDAEQSEEDVIGAYASVPLLVLDEVGVGFGTDGELVQLFEVIDRRYQLRRPVMLISNLAAPDLRTAIGDRLFDRLREGAKVLVCDWPSHRAQTGRSSAEESQ